MRIEARALRIADVVRVPGYGEGEVVRRHEIGPEVRVWFRGEEDKEKPSMVFDETSILEVARPGDLFRFKPPLVPRQKRIVDALTPLGWIFHTADVHGGADHLHDAIDMTRVEFQGERVVMFVKIMTDDGWAWPLSGLVLGTLDEFSADFENQIHKLEATSLLAQWELEAADKSRAKAPVPDVGSLPRPVKGRPVIVRYSETEGVLLCGDTKTHKEAIKKLVSPYRFRYSKRLPQGCAWYVQRSRGTVQERAKLESLVAVLRGRGVPVELDYVAPSSAIAGPIADGQLAELAELGEPVRAAPVLRAVVSEPSPRVETRGPGRPADRQRQAEKLRDVANRLVAGADATIGTQRLENTHRRAEQAKGIRARAYSDKVIAGALMLAADEVERGELTYIARLTTRPQVDDLEAALAEARRERVRNTGESVDEEPELADIPFARFTGVALWKSDLRELMDFAGDRVDAGRRKRMRPLAEGEDQRLELLGDDVDLVRAFLVREGKDKLPLRIEGIAERIKRYDRLGRLGVRDTASLRAALREYLGCCRGHQRRQADDPLATAKRELQFAKIPGYFPTPSDLASRMVAAAGIDEGMRVLEPSAGSGSIAEVIRARHPDATLDVLEVNASLRGLLQAQGFALVGDDFLSYAPAGVRYDRIVMNPPFEKRQDTRHIDHALDMLAPGGRLVAIASGSFESRPDRESVRLRERLDALGGRIETLPAGSFSESGTDVRTVLVVVDAEPAVVQARPVLVAVAGKEACACKTDPAAACACKKKAAAEPKREVAVAKPAVVASKPAVVASKPKRSASNPIVAAPVGPIQPAAILERWREAKERRRTQQQWTNITKTACFELRDGDEDSVTLCPVFLPKPVGHCPPMKNTALQFGLCEFGEEVETFPVGSDNKGVIAAKAEGAARFARLRSKRASADDFDPNQLPAGDDFEAMQAYLDRVLPSRVVFTRDRPLAVIDVYPDLPELVTPSGSRLPLGSVRTAEPGSTLEPRVHAGSSMPLTTFLRRLDSDLIGYRGLADAEVLRKVVGLVDEPLDEVASRGGSLADVQHAVARGRSIYWMRSPSGQTWGPITADGKTPTDAVLESFGALHGALPFCELPEGWDAEDTVIIAAMVQQVPAWSAWNQRTLASMSRKAGQAWAAGPEFARRATWKKEGGFADFSHSATHTILQLLEGAPPTVAFHVAGPWSGYLFPSDFGRSVVFEPPSGGAIDLDELQGRLAEIEALIRENPKDTVLPKWAKLAPKRVRWAKQWLGKQAKAERAEPRASKPAKPPKPAAAKKKPAIAVVEPPRIPVVIPEPERPPVRLAVVPDVEHEREQEQPMKTSTQAKKKAGKKKAAAEKPVQRTTKKAGKKKAAAVKKPAAIEKPVQRTTKKTAAKKKAAAVAKKPATKVAPPVKIGPAKVAAGPVCVSDDTCPPELDTWRNRVRQGDRVRFRKNSKIAGALGIRTDRVFEVRCTVCREGQRFAILDLGLGSANDVALPIGQFAVVERVDASLPDDLRDCVAKLAKLDAPLSPETRRLVAKLARGR